MDGEYSLHDNLETVLQNPHEEPCDISLQCLRVITNNFSSDRELGKGGFGVVYKVRVNNILYVVFKLCNGVDRNP